MSALKKLVLVMIVVFGFAATSFGYGTNEVWLAQPKAVCINGTNCMTISAYAPLEHTNAVVELWMSTKLTNPNGWFLTPGSKVVGPIVRTVTNGQLCIEVNYNLAGLIGGKFFKVKLY